MTVSLIISTTSGGSQASDVFDFQEVNPGSASDHQDFFIRHTSSINPITDCTIYIAKYTGDSYSGVDADADYAEVLGWGDDLYGRETTKGALYINQVIPTNWTVGDEFNTSNAQPFRTGYGTSDNQIILTTDAISKGDPAGVDGVIPVNGEAHIQLKFEVPTTVSRGAGARTIMLVVAYSATS